MKRILSLLVLCAAAGVLLFAAIPAGARTTATTVKVTAKEYKFILSTKTARHGTVIFKVTNRGKIKHDFKIAGKKTIQLKPNKSATLTVVLKKGKHPYICTVDSHAKFGMKGVFRST